MTKDTLDQGYDFWKRQASNFGQSPSASWSDNMLIQMEIPEILKWISDGDIALDVGCANGYSTTQFAIQKSVDIRGLDYVPEMIVQAKKRLSKLTDKIVGRVTFDLGDVSHLSEPTAFYDKVISTRSIINLGEWHNQLKGLRECSRVLKPGGLLLLSEATLQGWNNLNRFRREWGLPDIPMPSFNQYLDQEQVIHEMSTELEIIEISNFSSTYYVGTRVLKPLLIKALDAKIDVGNPNMDWNRWFSQLPSWGDYGTQKLFVFKKRA